MIWNSDFLIDVTPSLKASLCLHNIFDGNRFVLSNADLNKYFSVPPVLDNIYVYLNLIMT